VTKLSEALLKLLKNKEQLSLLGETGKMKVIAEFSLEKMSEGLSKVYNSLI